MKSRLVVLTMLVFGMLLSTAGAGLAISGLSDDASVSQYGAAPTAPAGGGGVLGDEDTDAQPESNPDSGVQPSRQSEAGASEAGASTGSSLPFTGFAALPILIGGIALLTAGLVARRKSAG